MSLVVGAEQYTAAFIRLVFTAPRLQCGDDDSVDPATEFRRDISASSTQSHKIKISLLSSFPQLLNAPQISLSVSPYRSVCLSWNSDIYL